MPQQSMWVHGHSAVIQLNNRGRTSSEEINNIEWSSLLGERVGWGVMYRGQDNSDYWFHFAIPTPAMRDGRKAKLISVTVFYTTEPQVQLRSVHVSDGPTPIFRREGLALEGIHVTPVDGATRFALQDRPEVSSGIGISLLFNFTNLGNVTLHAAGGDFDI